MLTERPEANLLSILIFLYSNFTKYSQFYTMLVSVSFWTTDMPSPWEELGGHFFLLTKAALT
jgi:hypothetical protein